MLHIANSRLLPAVFAFFRHGNFRSLSLGHGSTTLRHVYGHTVQTPPASIYLSSFAARAFAPGFAERVR
jgi:hypothetical protein